MKNPHHSSGLTVILTVGLRHVAADANSCSVCSCCRSFSAANVLLYHSRQPSYDVTFPVKKTACDLLNFQVPGFIRAHCQSGVAVHSGQTSACWHLQLDSTNYTSGEGGSSTNSRLPVNNVGGELCFLVVVKRSC